MTGRGKGQLEAQYGLLTTIATEAGVSLSTVSKVVHRRRDVGARTRERVEELLARHGSVRPWERDPATPRQIIAVFRDLFANSRRVIFASGWSLLYASTDCLRIVWSLSAHIVRTFADDVLDGPEDPHAARLAAAARATAAATARRALGPPRCPVTGIPRRVCLSSFGMP
ncbi:LacI family DNA-binding transcriptional regulator [Streptomyces sp. NPDC058420]|uniref:LacI family DNA-binding transcriptional regulator n=1 Tax=Streptomyces sp. NPDC058420 TaxID=3346489 RepID=UPI0036603C18